MNDSKEMTLEQALDIELVDGDEVMLAVPSPVDPDFSRMALVRHVTQTVKLRDFVRDGDFVGRVIRPGAPFPENVIDIEEPLRPVRK